MIEILEYIASGIIVFAFVYNDEKKIRQWNIIGAFLLGLYGILTRTYPTAIANWALVLLNVYKLSGREK